jgi:hypothetical protein
MRRWVWRRCSVHDNIPTLPDITSQWMTTLLQSRGYDVEVSDIKAEPIGTGQVGATYRFSMIYQGDQKGAPPTLVGKFPSHDPLSRETGKSHLTYLREAGFYGTFAGKKPLPVPDCHYIVFDDDSHDFALIMGDLPAHTPGNQLSVPSALEAQLAMVAAAAIHASWWGDPVLDTLPWLNGSQAALASLDVEALYTMFWPAFCDRYGTRVGPAMKQVGDAFVGHINEWLAMRDGPRCLTHNDYRPDNMLFDLNDGDRPIVIVDWQTVGVGTGASDIAYYMGTALDPATRAAIERDLFALYVQKLITHGVPEKDTNALWSGYQHAAFSGFMMGVTASIVVEQTQRGDTMFLTMCERSAAMVLDHGEAALPR